MAKLATDILAIQDMMNSFKNSKMKVEDIFNIINKNEGLFLGSENVFEMDGFFNESEMDEFEYFEDGFIRLTDKKGKRYLN